jgi:hypothetical protein
MTGRGGEGVERAVGDISNDMVASVGGARVKEGAPEAISGGYTSESREAEDSSIGTFIYANEGSSGSICMGLTRSSGCSALTMKRGSACSRLENIDGGWATRVEGNWDATSVNIWAASIGETVTSCMSCSYAANASAAIGGGEFSSTAARPLE